MAASRKHPIFAGILLTIATIIKTLLIAVIIVLLFFKERRKAGIVGLIGNVLAAIALFVFGPIDGYLELDGSAWAWSRTQFDRSGQ